MDESLEGLAWLIAQLTANATVMATLTGGIWPLQAPAGAAPPYGVITPMGGADKQGVAGARLFYEGVFQVRFWGYATQSDSLKSAANAADGVLQPGGHSSSGTSPGGAALIMSCIRDHPLPPLPDWDGQQLRIGIGGLYRLQIRSLP